MARLGIDPRDPTDYTGLKVNAVPLVSAPREPLPSDNRFPLFTEWRIEANPSTGVEGDFWKLVSFSGGDALWRKIGEGGSGSLISLSDTSDTIVYSDATGNIKLEAGAGITVTSTPASNKLTFALAGGGTAVDQIAVQSATGPGVTPVTPTAAGQVTISGATVAAHSVPLETHTRALNALNLEVQVAAAVTGAPGSKVDTGLSVYDDTHFTVDADGYVQLLNGVPVVTFNVDSSAGTGTDPVGPDASGVIAITGGVVSAHSIPVETVSRNPNEFDVDVQVATTSTGAPGTKVDTGLSIYESTQFSVDTDGYVTLAGLAGFSWVEETTTSRSLSNNQGVIANNGSLVTLTLPTTAALGTIIRVAGKGSGLWSIAQNASQRIHYGGVDTTLGAGGSLSAGGQFDCVELLCTTANTRWTVLSSQGSLIAV